MIFPLSLSLCYSLSLWWLESSFVSLTLFIYWWRVREIACLSLLLCSWQPFGSNWAFCPFFLLLQPLWWWWWWWWVVLIIFTEWGVGFIFLSAQEGRHFATDYRIITDRLSHHSHLFISTRVSLCPHFAAWFWGVSFAFLSLFFSSYLLRIGLPISSGTLHSLPITLKGTDLMTLGLLVIQVLKHILQNSVISVSLYVWVHTHCVLLLNSPLFRGMTISMFLGFIGS